MLTRVKKNTWKGIFLLTALITSFLGWKFLYSYYTYYSLSERASARVLEWEIEEITKSKYAIAAVYEFEAQDKVMMGRTLFTRPYFPNYYSAEINLEEWQSFAWDVWYQVKNPKKSTMEHLFPYKPGIHFLLALGVCGYFLWLNFYMRKLSIAY